MEQEIVCSASNLIQHYEAVLGLVLGSGLTDADKYAICATLIHSSALTSQRLCVLESIS